MTDFHDDEFDERDEDEVWCDRCQGSGIANCYCGGDQCYCQNNGEMDCPRCRGEGYYVPTAKQIAAEAEAAKLAREFWASLQPAPVDTNPKGGDAVAAPFIGSAVGEAEASKPLSDHRCSRREGFGDE